MQFRQALDYYKIHSPLLVLLVSPLKLLHSLLQAVTSEENMQSVLFAD
jgi:hypothetical protein